MRLSCPQFARAAAHADADCRAAAPDGRSFAHPAAQPKLCRINQLEITMMKAIAAATVMTIAGSNVSAAAQSAPVPHRYLVERTFPVGALDGVDAAAKQKVNANNKALGVNWEKSYANADKTKTYCVYDAPDANAVREAAKLNGLPVDTLVEIPADLKAEPRGAVQKIQAGH